MFRIKTRSKPFYLKYVFKIFIKLIRKRINSLIQVQFMTIKEIKILIKLASVSYERYTDTWTAND